MDRIKDAKKESPRKIYPQEAQKISRRFCFAEHIILYVLRFGLSTLILIIQIDLSIES